MAALSNTYHVPVAPGEEVHLPDLAPGVGQIDIFLKNWASKTESFKVEVAKGIVRVEVARAATLMGIPAILETRKVGRVPVFTFSSYPNPENPLDCKSSMIVCAERRIKGVFKQTLPPAYNHCRTRSSV